DTGTETETGVDGSGPDGEAGAVTGGTPGAVADAVGSGVEPAPVPAVVPPLPVLVPLPVPVLVLPVLVLPAPAGFTVPVGLPLPVPSVPVLGPTPASAPVPGRSGEVSGGSGSDPNWAVVSTPPSEPAGPSARCCEDPGMRTAIADAAGAGPEAGDPSGPRGSRRM